MRSVAVIGAGITGLTAAFTLKRRGVPVTVYEAAARVGGVIESVRRDGYLAESGPNTLLDASPRVGQLIRDAGLHGRRIDAAAAAKARYVVRGRRPVAIPGSPLGLVTTRLFSLGAKRALLREPFIAPRRDGVEESVAEFVVRRLDQEWLDRAIDALVAGIYAGDPYRLSVTHAFPKLKALEDDHGSLIRGRRFGARSSVLSFDEGLQVLPDALAAELGSAVKLGTSVTRLTQGGSFWTLGWRDRGAEGLAEHGAVVYCGSAFALATLTVEANPPVSFETLAEIRYPPVASVVLGFRREDVAHSCDGFGLLIPRVEGFRILGTIFSSTLFPNRAPSGCITLSSYVGGERHPELASRSPEELFELACEDLRVLLGVHGPPTFRHCAIHPRAIPQYNVGYGRYRELMSDIERRTPGLFLAGHFRDGVSLSDSIASGANVADRVAASVDSRPA